MKPDQPSRCAAIIRHKGRRCTSQETRCVSIATSPWLRYVGCTELIAVPLCAKHGAYFEKERK